MYELGLREIDSQLLIDSMNMRYDYANDRIITRKRKISHSRRGWEDSWTSEHYLNLKTGKYMDYPYRNAGLRQLTLQQRKYRLPISQLQNIIRSSSMIEIGGRNLWKHQIRRIYDVKHSWELKLHCDKEEIKAINQCCECGVVKENQASIKCYAYIDDDGIFNINEPHQNKTNFLDRKFKFGELYTDPTLDFDDDGFRGLTPCFHSGDRKPIDSRRPIPICDCCQEWKNIVEPTFTFDRSTRAWSKDVVKEQNEWLKSATCKCIPRRFANCGCYDLSLSSNRDVDPTNPSKKVKDDRNSKLEYQLFTEATPQIKKVFLAQSPVHHDTGTRYHWTYRENHSLADDVIAFINCDYPEPMGKHPVLFTGKLHNPILGEDFLGPSDGMLDPMQFLTLVDGEINRMFRRHEAKIDHEALSRCSPILEDPFIDGGGSGICGQLFSRENRYACLLYSDFEQPDLKSYQILVMED